MLYNMPPAGLPTAKRRALNPITGEPRNPRGKGSPPFPATQADYLVHSRKGDPLRRQSQAIDPCLNIIIAFFQSLDYP
jgi:hypothetical protein